MKAGLRRIDDFLLTQLEKVCHWFQCWTGLTNFWVYGKLQIVIVYCVLASLFAHFSHTLPRWLPLVIQQWGASGFGKWFDWSFAIIVIPVGMAIGVHDWKNMESDAFRRLQLGLANPHKINNYEQYWRLFLVTLTLVVGGFNLVGFRLFNLCVLACVWLRACDPLPPCEAKIKEWWHSAKPAQLATVKENR